MLLTVQPRLSLLTTSESPTNFFPLQSSSRALSLPPGNFPLFASRHGLHRAMSAARDSPSSVVRCATIKQAKAAYKARGRPTLSEAEQRQLQRNVKLDQRAWAIREREKKRAETAKKRVEKEHEERKKQAGLLGSQRRCDRFGHKSSQFHLGAFFAAGANKSRPGSDAGSMSPATSRCNSAEDDEAFGDDGVDDDDLLSAMDTTHYVQLGHQFARSTTVSSAQDRPALAPRTNSSAKRPAPASPRPIS